LPFAQAGSSPHFIVTISRIGEPVFGSAGLVTTTGITCPGATL